MFSFFFWFFCTLRF